MLGSIESDRKGSGGWGWGSEEEERMHLYMYTRECLMCVWRGKGGGRSVGGGGVGGFTVLKMMNKQQNCHSNVCRSIDCCAYIIHASSFFISAPFCSQWQKG